MKVYDYHCPNGHTNEHFVQDDAPSKVACATCGVTASRTPSAPRVALDGTSGDFPGAAMKWEAKREKRMAEERRHKDRHGTEWIGQSAPSDQ